MEEVIRAQIEELLGFFEFLQLPPHLQTHSRPFHALAHDLAGMTMWSFELVEALRNLLRAKDAAVRARKLEHDQHQAAARSRAAAGGKAQNDG
jgi:hypothetical protein